MLISQATSEALDELVGAFFDLNRTTDRMVSIMQNTWCMPQAVAIIHPNLAHLYPILADKVTEIKDRYNLTSVYPETHRDARTYVDLKDMFSTLLKENAEVYEMIKMIDNIVHDNGDFMVHADLVKLMQQFNVVIAQIITLNDKAEQLVDKYDEFDRHISSWNIDGLDLSNGDDD